MITAIHYCDDCLIKIFKKIITIIKLSEKVDILFNSHY